MEEVKKSNTSFAVAGLCGAFLFAVVWLVAGMADGAWTFSEDLFCDLGLSYDSVASNLFQYGLILTGLLLAYLGIGKVLREKKVSCVAGVFTFVAGLSLVVLGGFIVDDNANIHETAIYLVMIFTFLAAALSAYGDFTNGKNLSGAASVVVTLGIIAACISGSLAFIESWTMLLLMIWMFTESLKLAFIAPAKN
jgi:hypothetical membrane protein